MAFIATKKETKKKICSSCGRELPLSTGFYSSKSPMFAVDGKINICKECFVANALIEETGEIDEVKFKNLLRRTDFPYYRDNLQSATLQYAKEHGYVDDDDVKYHGNDIIKLYMKNVNSLRQLSTKTFEDSEKDGFIQKRSTVLKNANADIKMLNNTKKQKSTTTSDEESEDVKWTKKDKQNMKYVISVVGYDPFEDFNLSEYDKKYCFNILAGYCDAEGISEDGHKIQCVIQLTNLYCQCRKIDESINLELSKNDVDETKISKLTSSKSSILSSIATIAKDNNIASNYNKNSGQGKNTLSAKMKEIVADGFENMKVNLFDIDTSASMKQIADLSNQSIMEQLTFDSNEYTEMIKEQREMLIKLQNENERLEEENRILKNKVEDLENKKR